MYQSGNSMDSLRFICDLKPLECVLQPDMKINFPHIPRGPSKCYEGEKDKQNRFYCQISLRYTELKLSMFVYSKTSQSLEYANVHCEFPREPYACIVSQIFLGSLLKLSYFGDRTLGKAVLDFSWLPVSHFQSCCSMAHILCILIILCLSLISSHYCGCLVHLGVWFKMLAKAPKLSLNFLLFQNTSDFSSTFHTLFNLLLSILCSLRPVSYKWILILFILAERTFLNYMSAFWCLMFIWKLVFTIDLYSYSILLF